MYKKYENKGLCGLKNLGNSCFMNSALQCLSNTIELTHYFVEKDFVNDYNNNEKYSLLTKEYYRLISGIYEENCTISPMSFYKTAMITANKNNINFGFYNQNDVQEFLVFFIDALHESLCKKVDINISGAIKNDLDRIAYESMNKWKEYFKDCYSKIIELFYGQMVTFIEVENSIKSRTYNPICFFTLPIANKENVNIYDCFELFTESETLEGDNKWFNDKNNNYYEAQKKTIFWKFPNILIVSFKRFNNFGRKKNVRVDFPLESLDLTKYCIGYDKHKSYFDLFGICNHVGNSNSGHYFSYCKNQNNKWYEFNDNNVREIDSSKIVTSNAYVLFFRKVNSTKIK
jgi:ubiquitin carboxyl-terminal hydrolase 8